MRITKKVFHDLAIWMVGFGLAIGTVFPFFVRLLGVDRETAMTPGFFGACLAAGAVAGGINFWLARTVVGRRINLLASGMLEVETRLRRGANGGSLEECDPETCAIEVDSDDELGDSARAFNRLVETLATTLRTQEAVRSFSEMLTSELELAPLAAQALEAMMQEGQAEAGAIFHDIGGELELTAAHGIRDAAALSDSDVVQRAVRTGDDQSVVTPDDVVIDGVLTAFRPSEVLVLPVIYERVPLGVVVLAGARTFDEDSRRRASLFRHGLSLALRASLTHDRMRRLAALDPLTGVYNRRFGLGRLSEELGRAMRMGSPLGVLMADIDHFKSVNDTYGHVVGDRVLKAICATTRASLREGDVLVRYGGEELLVVLPAAAQEDLKLVAERIRRSVEETALREGEQQIGVTVSVGGAAFPAVDAHEPDDLIGAADEALYRAKRDGRNRVDIS